MKYTMSMYNNIIFTSYICIHDIHVYIGTHAKSTGTIKHIMKGSFWLHSNLYLKNSGIYVVRGRFVTVVGGGGKTGGSGGVAGNSGITKFSGSGPRRIGKDESIGMYMYKYVYTYILYCAYPGRVMYMYSVICLLVDIIYNANAHTLYIMSLTIKLHCTHTYCFIYYSTYLYTYTILTHHILTEYILIHYVYYTGKTLRITKGPYKGMLGQVVDVINDTYNIELLAKMKKIVIEKSKTVIVGGREGCINSDIRMHIGSGGGVGGGQIYDGGVPATPFYTQETPHHMQGNATPHQNYGMYMYSIQNTYV